jgi:DUF917 family protein
LADPKAALLAENLARNVAIAFGMICGLGGWVMDKASVVKTLPEGTISIAESVGAVLRDKSITKKFDALSEKNIVKCKEIVRGPVVNAETKLEGGFDFGFFEVKAEDGAIWRVDFQNENLVLSVGSGSIGEVKMTVPDIIACYNMDTGEPLTNADMFYDDGKFIEQNVVIGAIKVDEKWWMRGEEHVYSIWQEFFRRINYSGPIVKY